MAADAGRGSGASREGVDRDQRGQASDQVRAYVSARELATSPDPDGVVTGQFLAIEDVAGKSGAEAALLEAIDRDLQRLRNKYRSVEQFGQIVRDLLDEGE